MFENVDTFTMIIIAKVLLLTIGIFMGVAFGLKMRQ